jgi:hypothetical protein
VTVAAAPEVGIPTHVGTVKVIAAGKLGIELEVVEDEDHRALGMWIVGSEVNLNVPALNSRHPVKVADD